MTLKLKIYSSLFFFSLCLLDPCIIASQTPPTLQEILDPSKPWGLNLDLVDKRQKFLRHKGDANDVSTKIVLYRGNKAIMAKKIKERLALQKTAQDIETEAKIHLKSLSVLNLTAKNKITKKRDQELANINKQIDEINSSLALYKDINRKLINNIIQLTGLSPEKIAKIPASET